jgi:leucyl-tRNA synthetase
MRGLVVEDEVEVVVQVNGKTRGKVTAPRDAAVRRFTEGKVVRKVVRVANRLLNLVVG